MTPLPAWEEVDHTADWALRVRGADSRELLENAALGMVALIGGVPDPSGRRLERTFNLNAPDAEMLLVDWLTELLNLIEEENVILDQIQIASASAEKLAGSVSGQEGGEFTKQIKAVTYHNLAIHPTEHGLETVIVFDV